MRYEARHPGAPTRLGGYTLVEMLIVIVILGIGSALVIPTMGDAGVLRIQSAVRTLVADLTFAQTDALAYQQRRAILFDEDANAYTIAEVAVSSGGEVDYIPLYLSGGPSSEYIVDFDVDGFDGARLRLPDFNGDNVLIFDEIGAPVAEASGDESADLGTIYIDSNRATFRVDIAPYTGQVHVEKVDELPG